MSKSCYLKAYVLIESFVSLIQNSILVSRVCFLCQAGNFVRLELFLVENIGN